MIDILSVILLFFLFTSLGFALGYTYCDKKVTDDLIDYSTKLSLMLGQSKILEDFINEKE